MESAIETDYKRWLINLACSWAGEYGSFYKLIEYLYSVPFTALVDMDENRILDGKDLRLRFTEAGFDYNYRDVYNYIYNEPCSVLEIMVGLAFRIEDHIMYDPDKGDRSYIWFYDMLRSLKIDKYDDFCFREDCVEEAIDAFINRRYLQNGEGGLFTVYRTNEDMRELEIWGQACRYVDEILDMQRRGNG